VTPSGVAEAVRPGIPAAPPRRRLSGSVAAAALVAVAATALVVAWLSAGGPATAQLEVRDGEAGTVVFARPMAAGESFQLTHTHSVTKRPVVETFSVADAETLALEELWFDEFGPNLPAGPEQLGDHVTFLHEDGAYRVLHHGFRIGTVPVRVGSPPVDHVLTFADGERVRLLDIARAGAWVELGVRAR
jgi:hypothetical protein